MSVATFGYIVDLDRLRSAAGSKDGELQRAIESRFEDDLRENDEMVAAYQPEEITLRAALRDLIAGDVPAECDTAHLLAFETLCKFLGERLDDDDRLADLDDLEIQTGLLTSGPPVALPGFADRVGFLTADQVRGEYARLKDDDLAHDDPDIEAARIMLRSFLEQAQASGLSLVTITC
jgi:hypothetical protein